jgi:hypothetical protein
MQAQSALPSTLDDLKKVWRCRQQFGTMADKIDPRILEVVGRQLAQDLGVNRVIQKRRGVLFEP